MRTFCIKSYTCHVHFVLIILKIFLTRVLSRNCYQFIFQFQTIHQISEDHMTRGGAACKTESITAEQVHCNFIIWFTLRNMINVSCTLSNINISAQKTSGRKADMRHDLIFSLFLYIKHICIYTRY